MEKSKNNIMENMGKKFKNIVNVALLFAFTFVPNKGFAQNTINNDANNIRTSQTINRINLSDYQSLLDKRNQMMKDIYKGYDVVEVLESTQKEVFLRAYKHNAYLVRTNINSLQKILDEKFGIKLEKNTIEILNHSLIELGKNNEIDGLNYFTNSINPKKFDINTINAIGLIEANYPDLWQKSKGELMPTWNVTNQGLLDKLVILLKKTERTANLISRTPENNERIPENKKRISENSVELDKKIKKGEDVGESNKYEEIYIINLDDKENDKIGNNEKEELKKVEQNNKEENKKVEINTNRQDNIINLDQDNIINLDDENDENDDNLEIVTNMSWNKNVLEQKLTKDKLNNISFDEILDVVESFGDDELKKAFVYHLLCNDVIGAQKIMGMDINCDNRYPDYKAGNKLGKTEFEKVKNLGKYRKYMAQNEILANKNIPQDVKNVYLDFVAGKINNKGREYSILSKTDFKVYLFSANHYLLSRQNTLLGSELGDHANNPMKGIRTTPGGLYEVGNSFDKSDSGEDFFKKYGTHYIVLMPMENQYIPSNQYTMGLHGTYERDKSRDGKIKSSNARDRRVSNGCINVTDETFGEIFNHLKLGTMFFVTREPNSKDIENFLANKE